MKDEILCIASNQLMAGGYDALNFARIAEELETTRANLHHHFGNKEGLAREATERYIEASLSMMRGLIAQHPGDFPAYLQTIETMFLDGVASGAGRGCICSQLLRSGEAPDALAALSKSFFARKIAMMTDLIKASQAAGAIRKSVSAEFLALSASTMLMGLPQMAAAAEHPAAFARSMRGVLAKWVEPWRPGGKAGNGG